MNLNTFGFSLPFNQENLHENRFMIGPGTDRPIGFSFDEIHKLYWTVREFNVSITSLNTVDPFTAFMAGGGFTGTLVGSITGVAAANIEMSRGLGFMSGKTSILAHHSIKNREFMRKGVEEEDKFNADLISQRESSEIGISRNILGIQKRVNEGVICGAGPIHRLIQGGGQLIIDFSNIIHYRWLYWPKITISFAERNNQVVTSAIRMERDGQIINLAFEYSEMLGGVIFQGGGVIPLYRSIGGPFGNLSVASGQINIANGCCSRFFFDGEKNDEKRIEECEACKNLMGVED